MPRFERAHEVPQSPETVFAWHQHTGAFERLIPPWEDVRVLERQGGLDDGGTVVLGVRRGPVRLRWEAKHTAYEEGRLFRDEQVKGPFGKWIHTHRFSPGANGGCRIEDEVEWEAPLGPVGLPFKTLVEGTLGRLFAFRHERLANDLALHTRYHSNRPLTIAVTGSSGFLGRNLVQLLTSGGHKVVPVVRSRAAARDGAVYWNVERQEIDSAGLAGVDAVVHLAGEPLVAWRWTAEKKRAILRSRERGTGLIARTVADLSPRPRVLVCASAVGFYGSRGNEVLTEKSKAGRGFLAEVCQAWEAAADPARRTGVRVTHIRQGVALSPEGGVLERMLPAFKTGIAGRLGRGSQYLPWISLEDALGLMMHAIFTPTVRGPMNATAPLPVTNSTFTSTMGRVLARPTIIPVPALAVKALFGEMGRALLLGGQRAVPAKAEESGYSFFYPALEDALRFVLGSSAE